MIHWAPFVGTTPHRWLLTLVPALCMLEVLPATAQERPRRDAAPLPATARGPAIPQDKGYLVEEIRDGLYWVTDGTYQVMFLVHRDGVIAVDAPPNLGEKYLQAIREVTSKPVTHVIYSTSTRIT